MSAAEEPTFALKASDPGAVAALQTIARQVRVTNPARAQEIDQEAQRFAAWAQARRRPGQGFVPNR